MYVHSFMILSKRDDDHPPGASANAGCGRARLGGADDATTDDNRKKGAGRPDRPD